MSLKDGSIFFSIAFYNLENFFDSIHDEYTLDKDFTPDGKFQWNQNRYNTKIQNISKVISKISIDQTQKPPIFLGVSEVENSRILEDLIQSENLKPFQYDFVHYDSPDERGIDVAFLYQKKYFELIYSNTYTLYLEDKNHDRDFTRDILLISGKLFNEQVYVIVNHWPSRNNGINSSESKRVRAAKLIHEIISEIYLEDPDPNIIIMGDFNDEPNNNSIKNFLVTSEYFNPMLELQQKGKGSIFHNKKWYMLDQIIMSINFLEKEKLFFENAEIFNAYFLQEKYGKTKGTPLRTFSGNRYIGGFSDHFPVCAYFKVID